VFLKLRSRLQPARDEARLFLSLELRIKVAGRTGLSADPASNRNRVAT
jgi:hypothetical protein